MRKMNNTLKQYFLILFGLFLSVESLFAQVDAGNLEYDTDANKRGQAAATMLGIGVGFFFVQTNKLAFVGSLLAGIGVGLFVAALISKK